MDGTYDDLPYGELMAKFEETDPILIDKVRKHRDLQWDESDFNDYVRGELIDRTPDTPFLESDHARRDPGISRSILNLRYKGSRGSSSEGPRHPDLFYGFTGNDPRGSENNPRFDLMREQIEARTGDLTARMVDSAENQIAESPWTGQSISYSMKEVHRRVKARAKIFTPQQEALLRGSNISLSRRQLTAVGDEAFTTKGAYFESPTTEALFDGVRRVDRRANADRAPWHNSVGDMELGVQKYAVSRSAARGIIGERAQGGGKLKTAGTEQDWTESVQTTGAANRRTLAATMATAAKIKAVANSTTGEQDPGVSYEKMTVGRGLVPNADVAAVYRQVTEEQERRPDYEIQDDEGGQFGAAAHLVPATDPNRVLRASDIHTTDNDHLTNVASIITGLREGTAAGRRKIAGAVIADGARHEVADEAPTRRGLVPSADVTKAIRHTEMPLVRAGAAEGLTVHTYAAAAPTRPQHQTRSASYDSTSWQASREAMPTGRQIATDNWRSNTDAQTAVDREFGLADDSHGFGHAGALGQKRLRATASGDTIGMTDELNERF